MTGVLIRREIPGMLTVIEERPYKDSKKATSCKPR